MTKGKKEKEGSDLFLPKSPPPPPSSLVPFARGLRNETKKNVRLYTPPLPTPSNGRTHLPFSRYSGVRPRITPKKKKKKKLVGLVGWFVSFPYSFINHRHFFFFFYLVFCRVIVLLPFLYTYSFLDIVFTQVTSPNAPNFLRFFAIFANLLKRINKKEKSYKECFVLCTSLWLIANVENIGDVLVPVWVFV